MTIIADFERFHYFQSEKQTIFWNAEVSYFSWAYYAEKYSISTTWFFWKFDLRIGTSYKQLISDTIYLFYSFINLFKVDNDKKNTVYKNTYKIAWG